MREMTSMVTDVEVNRCALRVSGSEISWHLIVPISYHFIYFFNRQCKLGHLGYALSQLHFVPDMGIWDGNYSSCIECQGSVRWSLLLYNSAECFLNIWPISQAERERERDSEKKTVWEHCMPFGHTDTLPLTWAAYEKWHKYMLQTAIIEWKRHKGKKKPDRSCPIVKMATRKDVNLHYMLKVVLISQTKHQYQIKK